MPGKQSAAPFTESDQTLKDGKPAEPIKAELVKPDEQAMVTYTTPQAVMEFFHSVRSEVNDDPEAAAISIIARILEADDIAGVFDDRQVVHAGDVVYTPLELNGVRWAKSQFETGPGVFALMECNVPGDDSEILVTCSGLNVMAQLYRLNQLGAFPLPIHIEPSPRPTAAGYTPFWLKLDHDRAIG